MVVNGDVTVMVIRVVDGMSLLVLLPERVVTVEIAIVEVLVWLRVVEMLPLAAGALVLTDKVVDEEPLVSGPLVTGPLVSGDIDV